jgi:hypothetical protein
LKLKNKGDHAIIRLCHQQVRDLLEFGTRKPKLKDDGNPRKELVITGMFMGGTGVITTGPKEARKDETPELGSEVRLYLNGHKFGSWIEAKKALGALNVGDVVKITYIKDEKSAGGGADKKVWEFKMRSARVEDEAHEVAQAERVYHRIEEDGGDSDDDTSDSYEGGGGDDIPFGLLAALGGGLLSAWLAVGPVLGVWA